jgi:hypothetical protein
MARRNGLRDDVRHQNRTLSISIGDSEKTRNDDEMMTGILLDKLLFYYTDMYPTELNHNQQLANPNTLCQ